MQQSRFCQSKIQRSRFSKPFLVGGGIVVGGINAERNSSSSLQQPSKDDSLPPQPLIKKVRGKRRMETE
jgi:hypothetical protein